MTILHIYQKFQLLTPTCVFLLSMERNSEKEKVNSFLSPHFSAGLGKIFPKALPGGEGMSNFPLPGG